jgi:hypothetical protein
MEAKDRQKIFFYDAVSDAGCMTHNGPAIWGGCVTRRQHRHKTVPVDHKAAPVQGGYGAVFAIQVQSLLSITRVAIQA